MLRVFEAFSGYGSQSIALRNLNMDFEVVGISEIDEDVIKAYASIHTDFLQMRETFEYPSKVDMISYLKELGVPQDYKTFDFKGDKLKGSKLSDFYLACKLSKNYGDIKRINPSDLPDFDLFTYSPPCQDISVSGKQQGLERGSGTRSSLIWECLKIIQVKKPKYLLMENVKNLVGNRHKTDFLDFLKELELLGYKNSYEVLNACDYGIPHRRERVFCISEYEASKPFTFPPAVTLSSKMSDFLESEVSEEFYLTNGQVLSSPIQQDVCFCLSSTYWKGTTLKDFLQRHRRQLVTDNKPITGVYRVRRLTPRECWRLMGVSDEDFDKVEGVCSKTQLYRQAGNSIVVNVLEAIFKQLLTNRIKRIPIVLNIQRIRRYNEFRVT